MPFPFRVCNLIFLTVFTVKVSFHILASPTLQRQLSPNNYSIRSLTLWGLPIKAWADPKSGNTKQPEPESTCIVGRIVLQNWQHFLTCLSNQYQIEHFDNEKKSCFMSNLLKKTKSFKKWVNILGIYHLRQYNTVGKTVTKKKFWILDFLSQ